MPLLDAVVADGAGGAVVAWVDVRAGNSDVYAQRMDAAGAALWGEGGVAVCAEPSAQSDPAIAADGALADAVATATGNRVHGPDDIEDALAFALGIPGVRGVVIVVGDRIGAAGGVSLVPAGV